MKTLICPSLKRFKGEEIMQRKNLKTILNEGGYIDYRNIFSDLEKENLEQMKAENIEWDDSENDSELPDWIQKKWEKYDLKDLDK